MYGCESWMMKKAECQRIDAFELLCWRRLLRVPWTARRSNQSILKEISPEYSLEGLMMKLKLQYFGHLMWRTYSLEKPWCWERLKAGAEEDNRGWDGWMSSLIQWTWVWASFRSWWWTRKPGVSQSMGLQSQIRLSKWTENTVMVTYNATPSWSARFLLRNLLIALSGGSFLCEKLLSSSCFKILSIVFNFLKYPEKVNY